MDWLLHEIGVPVWGCACLVLALVLQEIRAHLAEKARDAAVDVAREAMAMLEKAHP